MGKITYLDNVKLFDSINGKIVESQAIGIEGNKISWVGSAGSFDRTSDIEIVDLSGKTAIPGLMDLHVHLRMNGEINRYAYVARTNTEMYNYIALKNGQSHLKAGFTSLRDCGGGSWGADLRRVFETQMFKGPRLMVAQKPIMQTGNQERIGPEYQRDATQENETLTGVDNITHAVRERRASGSDFIKTLVTGGVLHGVESKVERSLWTDEEFEAMTKEAHRLGMTVAAHGHGDHGINKAVRNNVDTVEHCTLPTEETLDLIVRKGTYLIPTQRAGSGLKIPEVYKEMPPEVQSKVDEVWEGMLKNHKIAFDKGVNIALGTDSGTPGNPHGTTAHELTFMVNNVGMSPIQAIQAGTIEAAKAMQKDDMIGSIETGKIADLVVINGDPTIDITLLESLSNILQVYKDGILMSEKGQLKP